jgi:hypothetical protein
MMHIDIHVKKVTGSVFFDANDDGTVKIIVKDASQYELASSDVSMEELAEWLNSKC